MVSGRMQIHGEKVSVGVRKLCRMGTWQKKNLWEEGTTTLHGKGDHMKKVERTRPLTRVLHGVLQTDQGPGGA